MYVPNAFTPDGDGLNDLFFVNGQDINRDEYVIQIFNRWGNPVYENSSYTNGTGNAWDGKDQSGKKLADGVYFYMIEVYDQPSGRRKNYNGQVTIMGSTM